MGFGGGEHAVALAAAHPEATLVACEVFENGICSMLSHLVPVGDPATAPLPPNLRLWPDDARPLLRRLPAGSVERLFLMFPDPWPKSRHEKRRFVHPAMLPEVARVLAPAGEWRIASDDPTYQEVGRRRARRPKPVHPPGAEPRAPAGVAGHALRGQGAAGGAGAVLLEFDAEPAMTLCPSDQERWRCTPAEPKTPDDVKQSELTVTVSVRHAPLMGNHERILNRLLD